MTTVNLVEDITLKVAELPLELQREVLHFVQFLSFKVGDSAAAQSTKSPETVTPDSSKTKAPFRSVMGALARPGFDVTPEDLIDVRREMRVEENAKRPEPPIRNIIGMFDHLGINITEEDIAEARREMWGNFPREEPR